MDSAKRVSSTIALTVDLEEWHHGLGLPAHSASVVRDTEWLLNLFTIHKVQATFFVLGEVAEKYPALIKRIASFNHEIGFHGAHHIFLKHVGRSRFASELAYWKPRLQDLTGQAIQGYRAPFFSLNHETMWALDELAQGGFRYDASIYSGVHDRIGWPGAPTTIKRWRDTELVLFPVPLLPGLKIGFSGGTWLKLLPWALIDRAIRSVQPAMVYLHPYEIAENPPVPVGAGFRGNLVRRLGHGRTRERLTELVTNYSSSLMRMGDVVRDVGRVSSFSPGALDV